MKQANIKFEIDSRQLAWVTLNRPDKHNALTLEMMQALTQIFHDIANNDEIRAVVLSGAGSSFCAGADLKWMQANLDKSRMERITESKVLATLLEAVDLCPKLVIGRINGQAYGGGIGLISVCDIAVCDEAACFSLTEVKLGLVPANIAPYLIRKIGLAKSRRLALNAYRFDGKQAVNLGLLDVAVKAQALDEAIESELKLALAAAPQAIANTKQLLAELAHGELNNPLTHAIEALADIWEGEEAQAGIRAFFDKQLPPWK